MKKVKLGELGEIYTGNTPSKKNKEFYNSNDIMFIKPDILDFDINMIAESNEYISEKARDKARIVPKNSLLVSCIGNIGKLGINEKETAFNQQINAIVHNEKIVSSKYLAYLLKYNQKKLESIANAPVVPIINKTQFSDFEVLIHKNIEIQNKIVEVLDKAQDLIDKKIEQIDLLDELVKSRFIEMFGNPISNPKGWKKMTLNDISMKKGEYGSGESAVEYKENYPRYIRITDIDDNGKLNNSKMTVNNLDEYEKYKLNDGDILLARTGATVGKTFLYKEVYGKCLFAGYLIRFIPNKDIINPEFLFAFTKTDFYKSWIKSKQNVVAQPNINAKQYGSLEIPIPPIELQNEFAVFVEKIDSIKAAAEKSLEQLNYNFNSLMQKAFKGELF